MHDQVEKAFQRSFNNLNLGYIDLYLIHYPVAYKRVLKNTTLPPDDVDAFELVPLDENGKNDAQFIFCYTSCGCNLFLPIDKFQSKIHL